MTTTEPLSARIAALEQQAANLPELHDLRVRIVHEIQCQQTSLADVDERIAEGQHAEIVLRHLTDQTDRVLNAGELLRGPLPDLPEPPEQDDHAAHVRLRRKVLEDQGYEPDTAAIIANHPEKYPSGPGVLAELAASQSNSESIRVEFADRAVLSITETPITEQTPADTTETVVSDSANSETNSSALPINSGQSAEPAPQELTNRQRLEQWISTLTPTDVATVRDAVSATGMPEKSAATYLPKIMQNGLLERVPGTGTPGVPSQYRLPGSTATSPRQPEEPVQERGDEQPDPPATDPADDEEQDDPEPTPAATTIAEVRPSKKARVLEVMQREPTSTLPPIPARLSTDECEVFDTLRKLPEGLTRKLLTHRLNWTSARTEKAVQSLVKYGHIGHNGDRLRVIPPEMQEGAA